MVGNSASCPLLSLSTEIHCIIVDQWRKAHKQLLAYSRYIVFYISKLYFYIFINMCGSWLFSNPITYTASVHAWLGNRKISLETGRFHQTSIPNVALKQLSSMTLFLAKPLLAFITNCLPTYTQHMQTHKHIATYNLYIVYNSQSFHSVGVYLSS